MPHAFFQPSEDAVPPEQVRFEQVTAQPWGDGRRVRVHFSLTPFQKTPNITLSVIDQIEDEVARAAIIEAIDIEQSFTLHIRKFPVGGEYRLEISVDYPEIGEVDHRTVSFELPHEPTPPVAG